MFNITYHYPALIAFIFIPLSIFLSIFFYRKTSLSRNMRVLLICIKSLAIFLLLVLLLEPSLLSTVKGKVNNNKFVLTDNTRSMNLPGRSNELKKSEIASLLKSSIFTGENFRFYSFGSEKIEQVSSSAFDSLRFNGFITDPDMALQSLRERFPENHFNPVIIISDGIFNNGGNPLYKAKLFESPFMTIGIGDTVQKKDVVIDRVFYNEKAMTDAVNPIRVSVSAHNIPSGIINVNLLREGSVTSSKTINVLNAEQTSDITFEVTENKPGTVRYKVEAEQLPGEITYKNNYTNFLIDYIENKINILFLSGGPGYDNSFLSDIFKRIKNYHTTVKTVKNAGEFYEGPIDFKSLGDYSAIVLQGFPTAQFSSEVISSLSSKVKENNIPLIFFASRNTEYKRLDLFEDLIPFSIARVSGDENLFSPRAVSGMDNELKDVLSEIESAPQIFKNVTGVQQKVGSEVLMTDKASGEPMLITRIAGKTRSAAFLGYGLWRWRLNEKSDYEKTAEKFIMGLVNFTISKEKKSKFLVYPSKNIFDYTEDIKYYAEVYDDNYSPVRNAVVRGKITSNGSTVQNNIPFAYNDNRYEAVIPPIKSGDYLFEADAETNNIFYAKGESRFLVDSINTEFLITKSNFENLRNLSSNTNGRFFTGSDKPREITEYLASLEQISSGMSESGTVTYTNLWENKYILLIIIGLFSVEWFIRKRSNLP